MIVPAQGILIGGRYMLVRLLARGGMGSVWIAHHRDLDVHVTVKFMAPALVASPDARMRFEREARVAARLSSQHVVQVHDYGVDDGTPYIIMELLQGESLSSRLAREGRLSLPVVTRLVLQICKALRTAHEAGLVHRDLKPGNVFLALKDGDEVVKILDFGIAKAEGVGDALAETASGMLLGSAHYMSPEQIRSSRKVDHRSDLWSTGVILYRVLTGRLPFPGAKLGDVLVRVCTDAAPSASSVSPHLPQWIDGFFERALAQEPDQRFQSAMDLSDAFLSNAAPPVLKAPSPAPRWEHTDLMNSPPAQKGIDPRPGVSARSATLRHVLGPTPSAPRALFSEVPPPSVRGPLPPAATEPAVILSPSSETSFGSLKAVQVAGQRVDRSPRHVPQLVDGTGARLWPMWAAAAVVTLVGIFGVTRRSTTALGSGATSSNATWIAVGSAGALPPVMTATAKASIQAPALAAPADVSSAALPAVSAAPSSSARAHPRLARSSGGIFRGDPFVDAGLLAVPSAQPTAAPSVDPTPPWVHSDIVPE